LEIFVVAKFQILKASVISLLHLGLFFKANKLCIPNSPLRHMEVDSWVTLDARRRPECFQRITIGQRWSATWSDLFNDAPLAYKISQNPTLLVFTLHCLYHMHHYRTLVWISS
jgi:hypothetical protein